MITIQSQTFPVCKNHLCTSATCSNPLGSSAPCRCDYACSYFGDCCVNQESQCGLGGASEQTQQFLDAIQTVDISQLSCVDLSPMGEQYMMVTSCSEDWEDHDVRAQCEDYQPSNKIDINSVPVEHRGSLTYRNVYCATCNGLIATVLTPWTVEFRCPPAYSDYINQGTKTLSDLLVDNKCELSIEPPSNSSASTVRQCLDSVIVGDCPPGSNRELRDMCAGSGYHGLTDDSGTTYRNPYCKACNDNPSLSLNDSYREVEDICRQLQPTTRRPPDRIRPTKPSDPCRDTNDTDCRGGGSLQPISLIMDFSQDSTIKVVNSESVIKEVSVSCEQGEVFDPFNQECLTLSCAQGYELRDNACFRLVPPLNLSCGANDDDLNIVVSVTIKSQSPVSDCLSDSTMRNITQVIENTLSLPTNVLRRAESDSQNLNNCTKFVNNTLNLEYEIDPSVLSYSELEDKVDRSLLPQDLSMSAEYVLTELTILQQCVSINGVNGCSGQLQLLQNAFVLTINGTMYVYDNDTANFYHSYETSFEANYRLQNGDLDTSYGKTFSIEICEQPKLLTCSLITQNASYFVPLNESAGSLSNTVTGEVLGPNEYVLTSTGQIQYCVPDRFGRNGTMNETTVVEIFTYDGVQQILSFVGVSISLCSLVITFATYSIFPHMRRCVSNKLIMVLCLVLFLAQLQQMLSGYGRSNETVCLALSALSHFLWINVFALTSCLAFELDRTLGSRDSFRMPTDNPTAVLSYLLFTVMTSSILVGCCLAIHFTVGEEINFSYGNEAVCWIVDWTANLVSFGCPLALFLIVNTALFVHTVTGIKSASKVRRSMLMENQGTDETLKDLKVYIKVNVPPNTLKSYQVILCNQYIAKMSFLRSPLFSSDVVNKCLTFQ